MVSDRDSLHSSHFPYLQFDNTREMWLLNGLRISREVATRLVLFFLPLYLYQIGSEQMPFSNLLKSFFGAHPNPFQQGMLWLAIFFLIRNLTVVLATIPLGQLINKLGPQRALVLSQISFVLYFWILVMSKSSFLLTLGAAVLDGLQTLFWASYYTVLSQDAAKTRMGSNLGLINFLLYLTTLLTPIFGGWLIVWQGFQLLFLAGICSVLVGAIFALQMNWRPINDGVSWREFFSWLRENQYQKLAASYVGRYLNDVVTMIWPLYIFFIVGSIDKVGYLHSLALFLAMLMTYVFGLLMDKNHSRRPFMMTGGVLSLVWLARALVSSVWSIVAVGVGDRLLASYHWLFFDRQFLIRGKGREALSFFIYREMIIGLAAVVFWVIFSLVFGFWDMSLKGLFILAAMGVWLSLLVKDHKTDLVSEGA